MGPCNTLLQIIVVIFAINVSVEAFNTPKKRWGNSVAQCSAMPRSASYSFSGSGKSSTSLGLFNSLAPNSAVGKLGSGSGKPSTSLGLFNSLAPNSAVGKLRGSQVITQYFEYWNRREMDNAADLFDPDCIYEDALYPEQFKGKDDIKFHLLRVADSLPHSFQFVVDEYSTGSDSKGKITIGVQWHVESDGQQLPFTRGTSIYKVNEKGLISYGFDVPEPTVKTGGFSLAILKNASVVIEEPRKVIAIVGWLFYCWFLFLSTSAPGPSALELDPATWNEVKDLSLNFWLVLPFFSPDSAPVVHPGLEMIFNMVLSFSGLFAGFLSDSRGYKERENLPKVLAGMQFLTNAAFLPYLITRNKSDVFDDDFALQQDEESNALKLGESKILPIILTTVFTASIAWGLFARPDFGGFDERFASLGTLLSQDRLGFSFLIDLVYFSVFQSWLVDDDVERREWESKTEEKDALITIAKRVPFFGLAYYLFKRPALK